MTALWGYISFTDVLTALTCPLTHIGLCAHQLTLTTTCLPPIHAHTHIHTFSHATHMLCAGFLEDWAPLDLSQGSAKANREAGGQTHLLESWKTTVFAMMHLRN